MRLVQIEYLDHCIGQVDGVQTDTWMTRDDAAKLQPVRLWQVGWIVHEDAHVIVLAPAVWEGDNMVGRPDVLVRSAVVAIIDLV